MKMSDDLVRRVQDKTEHDDGGRHIPPIAFCTVKEVLEALFDIIDEGGDDGGVVLRSS